MQVKNLISMMILLISTFGISGCATQANNDPLESLNRGIYKFNDVTDKALIKPVATVYTKVAPQPIRKGVSNFFSNLATLGTVVNDLLQFKFGHAFTDAGRFVINSTFGIAGLIDVAEMDNIPKHNEDFGQTLGYWGIGNGPYLVLPFFGPSSARDLPGLVVDWTIDPLSYPHNIGQVRLSNQLRLSKAISIRSELLNAVDLIDEASLDPYAFMRDAYLQRREILVNDESLEKLNDNDDFGSEYDKNYFQ